MDIIRKYAKTLSTVIFVLTVFITGFYAGNIHSSSQAQGRFALGDTEEAFEPMWEVFNAIQNDYVDSSSVDVPTLVNGAISGMVDALGDQYSNYLTPDAYSQFNNDLSGNFEGIGVVIRTLEETGEIEVVSILNGSPALDAGVRPGDIFYEVDGQRIEGMSQTELATLVRGPAGTDVEITFDRDGELITLNIIRARIELPNVETEILENNIAYLSLNDFSTVARQQINEALETLDVNSRNGFIFDLRGNPGGLLSSAIDVGSLFIEDGVLLYEAFGNGTEQTFEVNGTFGDINVPIVVLVDESSASASELVAGAIQDRGVATLIGETTFGKGTVQTIRPLSNGGGLRLTVARYLLPSRRWIQDVGVVPDIIVEWNPETVEEINGDDPQLQAAIDFLIDGESTTQRD